MRTMHKKMAVVAICVVTIAMSAAAQTVTGSGTSGTVPVFTGTSAVGSSPIAVSGSNIGIGTTTPLVKLQVDGQLAAGPNAAKWGTAASSITGNFNQSADQGIGLVLEGISTANSIATGTGSLMQFQQDFVDTWSIGMLPKQDRFSFMNGRGIGGASGTEVMSINGTNIGIGTTTPQYALDVAGQIHSSTGYIFPDGTTQTTAFIPANCGADYAESVGVTGDRANYEPGDILVIDPNAPGKFLKSNEAYSTMVAGIYSTKPGFVGRLHPESAETDKTEVPMAMVGRVPTKVTAENGPIKVGDLLVTSSTTGYAMKGTDRSQMLGAVVGKALGLLDSGTGVIEVLVTLQ